MLGSTTPELGLTQYLAFGNIKIILLNSYFGSPFGSSGLNLETDLLIRGILQLHVARNSLGEGTSECELNWRLNNENLIFFRHLG